MGQPNWALEVCKHNRVTLSQETSVVSDHLRSPLNYSEGSCPRKSKQTPAALPLYVVKVEKTSRWERNESRKENGTREIEKGKQMTMSTRVSPPSTEPVDHPTLNAVKSQPASVGRKNEAY